MILFFLGGAFALGFFALICGLCHSDTTPKKPRVDIRV